MRLIESAAWMGRYSGIQRLPAVNHGRRGERQTRANVNKFAIATSATVALQFHARRSERFHPKAREDSWLLALLRAAKTREIGNITSHGRGSNGPTFFRANTLGHDFLIGRLG